AGNPAAVADRQQAVNVEEVVGEHQCLLPDLQPRRVPSLGETRIKDLPRGEKAVVAADAGLRADRHLKGPLEDIQGPDRNVLTEMKRRNRHQGYNADG